MNYISQMNGFERWLEANHLPASSQLLWYKLVALCNRCGWAEWITVDNQRLMSVMQIRREATFIQVRNRLIETGLLQFQRGKKGSPNKYKLFPFKSEGQSEVDRVVKSEVYPEVQTADITKQNKTRQQKDSKKEISNDISKEKQLRPTLAQVTAYCGERGNLVDPHRWYDYYNANGWKVGKNPMKDWKAAVRNWERQEKIKSPSGFNQSGSSYDLGEIEKLITYGGKG